MEIFITLTRQPTEGCVCWGSIDQHPKQQFHSSICSMLELFGPDQEPLDMNTQFAYNTGNIVAC